ncbi:cation transporter [Propionimicrobium lymphophilum]|uniref:HMA domain-containing protein n=1 Tax=Propionimicrobium lymphophilum ACS-093-V-SCH5 TaxID=883161 RepID=S2VY83_9ACTN|nr:MULTISPECIES: cation transporter [Propionimicrobium]EPD32493.1 hypothetical protein HMPREF9306_02065 [Propionimicrobium lymphophilum ACS-093-V-SCH5]ETJ97070.1 heavy metal-associated domain protein [Propionimicrobium sp. BV2F7]MDK7710472.1 cation transporter [Propionimicrobium lymphophilum]MDK7734506.1 cation transporter [Propionimicrobium lymphophilum]
MITNYKITGMTCGHCVNAVTSEVSEIDGVTDVDVQLEGGKMAVTSESEIDFEAIKEAVDEAGDYTVELA